MRTMLMLLKLTLSCYGTDGATVDQVEGNVAELVCGPDAVVMLPAKWVGGEGTVYGTVTAAKSLPVRSEWPSGCDEVL